MRTSLLAAAAALLCAPPQALAQQPEHYVPVAQKELEASFMGKYFTLLSPIQVDTIEEDDDATFSFDVPVDAEITVLAACDKDCEDIDIEVRDQAGAKLGADRNQDAKPKVTLEAGHHPAKLIVKVYLRSCKTETCGLAAGAYR